MTSMDTNTAPAVPESAHGPLHPRPSGKMLDVSQALANMGGDEELYREIAALFIHDLPAQMELLRRAFELEDAKQLGVTAHSLKGSSSNIGAAAVQRLAARLEELAREGDWAAAAALHVDLRSRVEDLVTALEAVLEGKGALHA